MEDWAVFLLLFLALIGVCAVLQLLLCRFVKHNIVKAAPAVLFAILWVVCLLGAYDIIDLPPIARLAEGGFIAFPDYGVVALAGVPLLHGFALGWLLYAVLQRKYRHPR